MRGRITLGLPEVVVREVPKLFQTQLDAAAGAIGTEAAKLRDLGHDPGAIALPDSARARADFEQRLPAGLRERNVRNGHRPHRALQLASPNGNPDFVLRTPAACGVYGHDLLGGLIHEYRQAA